MTISTSRAFSPEYALLGFLAQHPAHGYQLHQRLTTELSQVWHISLSQTYSTLNRLASKDFITGELQTQVKLPARQEFHLTSAGRERFEKWLNTPSGYSVRKIRIEFVTRLYFASLLYPELSDQIIKIQISEIQSGLARLERILQSVPIDQAFNRLSLDFRIRQLRAALEWLLEFH